MTTDLYNQLGLTAEEGQVYTIIVSKSVRTAEEIMILASDLDLEAIQDALDGLEKRKFIRVIPGKVPQYIALAPAIAVTSEIDLQVESELNQIQEEIKNRWEEGQKELINIVSDLQKGPDLVLKSEKEFQSHIQAYLERMKTKTTEVQQQIKSQISNQNQKNSEKLENLITEFSNNLETELNRNTIQLEADLKNAKESQVEERKQHVDRINEIYSERIESLNALSSQMRQTIQTLQNQVVNTTENLNSTVSTINEQINGNIKQNKLSGRDNLSSIGGEMTKKASDRLAIIRQQIEAIQTELINLGEDSLRSIQEMVQDFSEWASKSSLSVIDSANEASENLWNKLLEMFHSLVGISNRLDEAKEKLNSENITLVLTEVLMNAKEELIRGSKAFKSIQTKGLMDINTDVTTQISYFQEKISSDISQLFQELEESIQTQYNKGIKELLKLEADISSLLEENGTVIVQESSETIKKIIQDLKQQTQPLVELNSNSFLEMIELVSNTEKTLEEDSELNLIDIITVIDELHLRISETLSERSNKLSESLQYLQNVANEEFSSFGSSANMMLGQMQSTLTENVAARTEEITQNFDVISRVSEDLNRISKNSQNEISRILDQFKTNIEAGNQTISETFDQDISNLAMDVTEVSEAAKNEQEEQIIASKERLKSLSEKIEKSTLELSRNIPTQLEEYQARHTDDFNTFDRAVKAELNKIRTRLTEINTEVGERLSKRVSLGKGGFQDIEKIVTSAMKDFESAQKRTEKLIDDQINNFKISSDSFASTINTTLNTQNLEIQRLMDTIEEDLVYSINSSYKLTLKNISDFSDRVKERYNTRKANLIDQLGFLLSTISASLDESLKQSLIKEFNELNTSLGQLDQTSQAPQELEAILNAEVENFIQNLQLAFQSASESGGARIAEVINEFIISEINKTFTSLKIQSDLSNLKEVMSSHWKLTSQKVSSILSQLNEELDKKSNTFLESTRNNLQNVIKVLEEAQTHLKTIIDTKIQAVNSSQKEKYQEIPTSLEENGKEIITNLDITNEKLQDSMKTITETTNESIKKISTQIIATTDEQLNDIRSLLTRIEETSVQVVTDIKEQYNNSKEVIDNLKSESLNHIKTIEQQASSERTEFIDQVEKINIRLESEINSLKSKVTELDKNFPQKKTQMEKEIQKAIEIFSSNVQDIFLKMQSDINSGKIQLSQNVDHLYQDFQASLETFVATAQNFISSLNSRHDSLLNQTSDFLDDRVTNSINTLEIEKKTITDRQQILFKEIDQNLTSFSNTYSQIITDSMEVISTNLQENITEIQNMVNEGSSSYYDDIDSILTETYSFLELESQEISKILEHDILNLVSEVDKKATQTQDTISSDLTRIIRTIPEKIGSGLTKSKTLMSSISDIQKIAMEVPIASVEETYLQTQPVERVMLTLEAMLNRTKSTIQIMVPKLSMIPWDLLQQAGTRRRIQILTNVDSQETAAKITQELGNVQLKHYENVEVYAFARDGTEEAAIGSDDISGVQLIITTDSRLIGVLKEIIQDLWPRGKTV
ncbi:MAG: hypothetical protein ACFFB5_11565 [Promethearchaeota archaeon]